MPTPDNRASVKLLRTLHWFRPSLHEWYEWTKPHAWYGGGGVRFWRCKCGAHQGTGLYGERPNAR